MTYNNQWLIDRYQRKDKIKYLFFWGHQVGPDGTVTQGCLSQWWVAPFQENGIVYPTAEHWMMAGKARLFKDDATLQRILKAKTPAEAKKLGRQVQRFNPVIWDEHKSDIVTEGNVLKFSQHPELKTFLLNTKDRVLVEASPVDSIWGIGMKADNEHAENPLRWKGQNLLGYALMAVRDKLSTS
ncbi:NADAR family protein [Chitinophaga qingshengii]|uniref:NADAR family protein n=1 Tax=Chitinophaga qingshengii TaxID=1569794 RepID=A0ABR7TW88_9BACT|nr:NADAR family protein [Chitinophaga qingshengii]MBC9933264.1 NADAR family protein [Chitinophaga qingshengii]